MNNAETETIVRNFYKQRLTNDVEACLPCFALNTHFRLAGSPDASPVACSCNGAAALRDLLTTLIETWRWIDVEFLSIIINGNVAAVHYRLTTEFTPATETAVTEIVDLHTVKEGKIVEFIEFVDTARASALAKSAADA